MRRIRVIPVLLIHKGGLYKSVKFKNHKYVGDPINAVKVFNEKEVDEIIVLDIDATTENRPPNFEQIKKIAGEAFMPLAYGGGIRSLEEAKIILNSGVEKIIFNSSAIYNPSIITESAKVFGSSSIVVSIDVKKDWLGNYKVYAMNGAKNVGIDPGEMAREMEKKGAGEIFINSIDKDGTFSGFDYKLINAISHIVGIPTIACGGAGLLSHFKDAVTSGASAVAAGSFFVFQMPHKAVLVTYPTQEQLERELFSQI